MSEVKRYEFGVEIEGCYAQYRGEESADGEYVKFADFNRVTAEREAALLELQGANQCIEKFKPCLNAQQQRIDALQALLTAADERKDVLKAQLTEQCALSNDFAQEASDVNERVVLLEGLVGEVLDAVGREPLDLDAVLRLRASMRAALKPAEGGGDECGSHTGTQPKYRVQYLLMVLAGACVLSSFFFVPA